MVKLGAGLTVVDGYGGKGERLSSVLEFGLGVTKS